MGKGLNKETLLEHSRTVLRDIEVRTAGQREGVALLHQKLLELIQTNTAESESIKGDGSGDGESTTSKKKRKAEGPDGRSSKVAAV